MKDSNGHEPLVSALAGVLGLDSRKEQALEIIARGGGAIEAARAAGVTRQTLFRWRTQDSAFRQALDAWRTVQRDSAYDRLSGLADACTNAVERAVIEGDARIALRVLEKIGVASDLASRPALTTVHTFEGFMVRVLAVGDDRPGLIAAIRERCGYDTEHAERLVGDGGGRHVAGPFVLQMAEQVAAFLRGLGAETDTVKVRVSYHEGMLPHPGEGEVMPIDPETTGALPAPHDQ